MAFFKFRKNGDEQPTTPPQPESVEAMRRRAKHRLIGAAVLVLMGVIGFPLLFDKQPRPISVDLPIEIPDRNKVKPVSIPAPAPTEVIKPDVESPVPSAVAVTPAPVVPKGGEKVIVPSVAAVPEASKKMAKSETKPVDKPFEVPLQGMKPVSKADEGAKAQALLDGKDPDKKMDASQGRYVVQVGAFSDATRAREVRLKVEHAGLKTYTQVAETKEGRRIRVRVGPFADKSEADKAAEKIRKLGLPAAILTL